MAAPIPEAAPVTKEDAVRVLSAPELRRHVEEGDLSGLDQVEAILVPGGFGTLDELFEVLTLVQTRKAHPVPILLYGRDFWQRLFNLDALVEDGTISEEDLALFQYVDSPQQAWQSIGDFYKLPLTPGR